MTWRGRPGILSVGAEVPGLGSGRDAVGTGQRARYARDGAAVAYKCCCSYMLPKFPNAVT